MMIGRDIYDALDRNTLIDVVLERKARDAAKTGGLFGPVRELFSWLGTLTGDFRSA